MEQDEQVPFEWSAGEDEIFAVRQPVDAGTDVIDLAAMRDQLEAERRKRAKGGE